MPHPALEVADIFRTHGAARRAAHAGHLSLWSAPAVTDSKGRSDGKLNGREPGMAKRRDGGCCRSSSPQAFSLAGPAGSWSACFLPRTLLSSSDQGHRRGDRGLPSQLKERAPVRLALELGRVSDRLREECASEAQENAALNR
jgi:hypothetical protein